MITAAWMGSYTPFPHFMMLPSHWLYKYKAISLNGCFPEKNPNASPKFINQDSTSNDLRLNMTQIGLYL